MNTVNFLSTSILKSICERLLLNFKVHCYVMQKQQRQSPRMTMITCNKERNQVYNITKCMTLILHQIYFGVSTCVRTINYTSDEVGKKDSHERPN